jgi:hypothetical protein
METRPCPVRRADCRAGAVTQGRTRVERAIPFRPLRSSSALLLAGRNRAACIFRPRPLLLVATCTHTVPLPPIVFPDPPEHPNPRRERERHQGDDADAELVHPGLLDLAASPASRVRWLAFPGWGHQKAPPRAPTHPAPSYEGLSRVPAPTTPHHRPPMAGTHLCRQRLRTGP